MTEHTLAEIRNGTGWPEGVRFAVVTEPPKRAAFPVDGVCTNCDNDSWNYTETVMQWCPLTRDELTGGGEAWFGNSGDFTTADDGADAHASCASCVTEFELPGMDWA